MGLAISIFLSVYVTAIAALCVVVYLIKEKKLKSVASTTPGIKYLWALCVLGVITALANGNEAGALIAVLLAVFFLIGAFARSVMTRALFDRMIEVSCAASVVPFVVAFIQYVTFEDDLTRISSVFISANYYAAVIEMVILFAVYKLCRVENRKQRRFYSAVIALNAVGLYFSGCRIAVFALCVAVLLMLLLYGRYKASAAFFGFCILLVAVMIGLPEAFPRMSQLSADMGMRIEIWRRALEGILKHPLFGEGALAFNSFHFVLENVRIVHTHSIYLEPILSFGMIGTGLILTYLKKNLSPIWKMRAMKSDRDRFVLAFGLLSCVTLHGIADIAVFSVQTGILLLLTLAMAGIQENPQFVLIRLPAYLHHAVSSQERKAVYASKNKSVL